MRRRSASPFLERLRDRSGIELLVIAGVLALVAITGLAMAGLSRQSVNAPHSTGALAATATATTTGGTATPSASTTEAVDEDLATYIAQLTATPVYVAPKPTGTPILPTPEPEPTLAAGINNEYPVGPFSPQEFGPLNAWKGPTSSGWMMVFAGVRRDQSAPGTEWPSVRVYSIETDASNRVVPGGIILLGDFDAPTSSGALRIAAADGDVLQLESVGGETLGFNVVTLEYAQ